MATAAVEWGKRGKGEAGAAVFIAGEAVPERFQGHEGARHWASCGGRGGSAPAMREHGRESRTASGARVACCEGRERRESEGMEGCRGDISRRWSTLSRWWTACGMDQLKAGITLK